MGSKRERGISLIEVLISASLFTIVILGISQTVLLMHRYSRATLCQYKAHLMATSYFESLLCDTHPYEFNKNKVALLGVDCPTASICFHYDKDDYAQADGVYSNLNTFTTSVYDNDNDLKVYMLLKVEESPLGKVYKICETGVDCIENSLARVCIYPPEGFQSLRLSYWYTSPFADSAALQETEGSVAYLAGLECGELYAIRPLNPDDPEYDI